MQLNIQENIEFIIVKGSILRREESPWISPFLRYIQENPQATPEQLCRELFADNGKARLTAMQNILHFFCNRGLLEKTRGKYVLTPEGEDAVAEGKMWKGFEGSFLATVFCIEDTYLLLHLQDVPEQWFENGNQDLEEFPVDNMEEFCQTSFIPYSPEIKIVNLEGQYRPTYIQDTEFTANFSFHKKRLTISGTLNNVKKQEESVECSCYLPEELADSLLESYDNDIDDDDEEHEEDAISF